MWLLIWLLIFSRKGRAKCALAFNGYWSRAHFHFRFHFFFPFRILHFFAFCIMPHFTIAIAVANTNPGSCKLKAPLFYLGSVFAIGEIAGGLDLLARVVGLWFVGF